MAEQPGGVQHERGGSGAVVGGPELGEGAVVLVGFGVGADVELLLSIFHTDMVWPWSPTTDSHDPQSWEWGMGRFDADRWRASWRAFVRGARTRPQPQTHGTDLDLTRAMGHSPWWMWTRSGAGTMTAATSVGVVGRARSTRCSPTNGSSSRTSGYSTIGEGAATPVAARGVGSQGRTAVSSWERPSSSLVILMSMRPAVLAIVLRSSSVKKRIRRAIGGGAIHAGGSGAAVKIAKRP